MTIRKKIENQLREEIISRGGQITQEEKAQERTQINLKINRNFLDKVDDAVKMCEGMNRNAWILQALQKKLNGND